MRRFSLALLCAAPLLFAEEYALGPDSQPQPGVPKGVVTKYKLEPGKFYPGTPHNYCDLRSGAVRRRQARAVHDLSRRQRSMPATTCVSRWSSTT